jgi:hypothetical protein
MNALSVASPGLGVLHVLEDALLLLRGGELPAARRDFVVSHSRELFSNAVEGSEISRTDHAPLEPIKWRALGSYSLVSRYLRDRSVRSDDKRLQQLASALHQLSSGDPIPEEVRTTSIRTLHMMCEQMSREMAQSSARRSQRTRLIET